MKSVTQNSQSDMKTMPIGTLPAGGVNASKSVMVDTSVESMPEMPSSNVNMTNPPTQRVSPSMK